jgi:predicted nucleic acid-binding protein
MGIIEIDPDDNKFVDAGLIAGADYIITYDSHFNMVKERPFPAISVLDPDAFIALLAS